MHGHLLNKVLPNPWEVGEIYDPIGFANTKLAKRRRRFCHHSREGTTTHNVIVSRIFKKQCDQIVTHFLNTVN